MKPSILLNNQPPSSFTASLILHVLCCSFYLDIHTHTCQMHAQPQYASMKISIYSLEDMFDLKWMHSLILFLGFIIWIQPTLLFLFPSDECTEQMHTLGDILIDSSSSPIKRMAPPELRLCQYTLLLNFKLCKDQGKNRQDWIPNSPPNKSVPWSKSARYLIQTFMAFRQVSVQLDWGHDCSTTTWCTPLLTNTVQAMKFWAWQNDSVSAYV